MRNLSNIPGWRTNRRIIVFESDDWGSIRMSSKEAYNKLNVYGIKSSSLDGERYLLYDGLASEDDLECLFEVLSSFTDKNSQPVVFTALSVVANPKFKDIKDSDYKYYFYETFDETLKRYPAHSRSFKLWEEGIKAKIFIPQFHGREHLNVLNWLKALRTGEEDTIFAFQYQMFGITPRNPINHVSYQAAFDVDEPGEIEFMKDVIKDGIEKFRRLHNFNPSYFLPTNGPFNNSLEETAKNSGIKFLGTAKIQKEPIGHGNMKQHFHFLGQKNRFGQIYLTRNCFFEPSSLEKSDWVDSCMKDISIAFKWNKPAIISTHRVNYIGWINKANRDRGLINLHSLFRRIKIQWPDAEFLTSDKLGELILSSK